MFRNIDKTLKLISKILFALAITVIPAYIIFMSLKETGLLEIKAWVYAGVKVSSEMVILSLFMYATGDIVENIRRIVGDKENIE